MQYFDYDNREMPALNFKWMHAYPVGLANIKLSRRRYSLYYAQYQNCIKSAGQISKY